METLLHQIASLFLYITVLFNYNFGYLMAQDTIFSHSMGTDSMLVDEIKTQVGENYREELIFINGYPYKALMSDTDTLILASIENVNLTNPRKFETQEEYDLYWKYRYAAAKVYPYAKDAIKIFRKAEYATRNMGNWRKKRYFRNYPINLKMNLNNLSKS